MKISCLQKTWQWPAITDEKFFTVCPRGSYQSRIILCQLFTIISENCHCNGIALITHKLRLTCFYFEVCCRLRETLICLQNARLQVRNTFTPLAVTNQLTNVHINPTSFYLNNTYKPDNDLKLNTCPVLILPSCEKIQTHEKYLEHDGMYFQCQYML